MPSDPVESRADRVERLFQEALDLPEPERPPFLEKHASDEERTAVWSLLRAVAGEHPVWSEGALAQEARQHASEDPGRLDRYRLEERIGVGGMGVVYRATRADDEFAKCVAIKIAQWEAGPRMAERFRRERQILAGLEHPNIARLLDGGTTADGRPFLVMEYVDGVSLDRYLANHALSVQARLNMFRRICEGVSCAHRNLVVHRDLKPSNILVTAAGEPKLLDFGIARLLEEPNRTATGHGIMTPLYASPEQISGGPVTTASDIYSLGLVLYEMLTGSSPYASGSTLELVEAILSRDPPPMKGVERDLETIVQMALRKQPARRYASVDHFSADLQRFLEGFPVTARADTFLYRTGKFLTRNRAWVAAAALVAAALTGGAAATARQARLAERRFNEVRKIANSYLFEVNDAVERLPGSTGVRQLVATRAQEYLDILSREKIDEPELLNELAVAYEKLADVQGRREIANTGDVSHARENLKKALALREQLHSAHPGDIRAAIALSHALALTGNDRLGQRDLVSAQDFLRRAVAMAERSVAIRPAKPDEEMAAREALATACQLLGDVLGRPVQSNLGLTREALSLYERALDLYEQNQRAAPAIQEKSVFIAATLTRLAQLRQYSGDSAGALAAYRNAMEINRVLREGKPDDGFYRKNHAVVATYFAPALAQISGDYAGAMEVLGSAATVLEDLARKDPNDVSAQTALADFYSAQGVVLGRANPKVRLRWLDRAVAEYESVRGKHPGSLKPDAMIGTLRLRTDTMLELRRFEPAMASAEKVLAIDDSLLQLASDNVFASVSRATTFSQMARAEAGRGHPDAARNWYQRSVDEYVALQRAAKLLPTAGPRMAAAQKALRELTR